MNEYLKNRKLSFLLASILYLALGLVLLIWPGTATTVICYAFGAVLAIYGLVAIISFFVSRKGGFAFELFLGIVAAGIGAFFLLGIFIVIDGLLNLKRAFELHRLEYGRWFITLILSLVSVALGLLVVFQPYLAAEALIMLIGVVFIYEGLSDLWAIVKVTRLTKELRKRMPVEVDPIDVE